jgi:PHD/YefM family antitoxin component YafN of YafNO toxin-antitoxin module
MQKKTESVNPVKESRQRIEELINSVEEHGGYILIISKNEDNKFISSTVGFDITKGTIRESLSVEFPCL